MQGWRHSCPGSRASERVILRRLLVAWGLVDVAQIRLDFGSIGDPVLPRLLVDLLAVALRVELAMAEPRAPGAGACCAAGAPIIGMSMPSVGRWARWR